jgi:acyl dehydratase
MATDARNKRHYEDIVVGAPYEYGGYHVTKDEIFAFAHAYDPQPHHIDEEAAKLSLVKGLCASGWHSCAMFMRMFYDGLLADSASMGGPAIDEVRWKKPVRPGDVLKARSTCVEKRLMRSRPNVGICKMQHEVFNQDDELVMTMENSFFIAVREPALAASPMGGRS